MNPILSLDNLKKVDPTGNRPYIFSEINSTVYPRDTIALIGASGEGKTTLLRVMARLEHADGGKLILHGSTSADWLPTEWRKKICYVPQTPVMFPTTVEDNLTMVSKLHRSEFDLKLAKKLMEEAGLDHIEWGKKAYDLSGGEKQRLQLVRSLLLRADIYLLDEVTSSLDSQSKLNIENMLKEINLNEGTALIWITHDLQQAGNVCAQTWRLSNGSLQIETQGEEKCLHSH